MRTMLIIAAVAAGVIVTPAHAETRAAATPVAQILSATTITVTTSFIVSGIETNEGLGFILEHRLDARRPATLLGGYSANPDGHAIVRVGLKLGF